MRFIFLGLLLHVGVLSISAQDPSTYYESARQKLLAGKYKEALSLYNKAIELSPGTSKYYIGRSNAHFGLKMSEEGFQDLCTAIKVEPSSSFGYIARGLFYYGIKELDKSILDYISALQHATVDSVKVQCLVNRSSAKLLKRDAQGAMDDCLEVLKMDSLSIAALNNLAMSLDDVGRGEESMKYFKKIISIDSNAFYAYMNIGFKLSNMGKYQESLPYFDKAIKLSPDEPYPFNNRGYSKLMLKDYEGALDDINNSIRLNPANSYVYRNRGLVYKAQGKHKKSCEDFDMAKRLGFTKYYGNEVDELIKSDCL
jgi:tetratricopeptide (TPR) repeat protein